MAANSDQISDEKIKVTLRVVKATNLYNADRSHPGKNDVSDPYVELFWHNAHGDVNKLHKVGQTAVIDDNLNPVWDEEFTFEVPSLDVVLHAVVWDKDLFTRDDYLGECNVELWEHVSANNDVEKVWSQLFIHPKRKVNRPSQGAVCFLVHVDNLPAVVYDEVHLIGAPEDASVAKFNEMLEKFIAENPDVAKKMEAIKATREAQADRSQIEKMASSDAIALRRSADDLRSSSEWKPPSEAVTTEDKAAAATKKARVMLGKTRHVASGDLPVQFCHEEVEGHKQSFMKIPRLMTKLNLDEETGRHCSELRMVGGSGLPVKISKGEEAPEPEEPAVLAAVQAENPWATPEKPPSKKSYEWHNWGDTIYVQPRKKWRPRSLQDVQEAIESAKQAGVTIRCVGHAHSWSPIFTDNGNDIMFTDKLTGMWKDLRDADEKNWRVTVLAGTTTGDLMKLLKKNGLYLPTNVISKLFIYGGLMSTGSHGSGWEEGLVLDYITQLQILDHNGKLCTYDRIKEDGTENEDWPYIVLNLGMYGIMYSITLRPLKQTKRALNIDYSIEMDKFWDTDLYKEVITQSHYTELFWFPFNKKMWVKVWNFTDDHVKKRPLAAMWSTFTQWLQSRIGHYVNPLIASHNGHWPLSHDFWRDLTPEYLKAAYTMLEFQLLGSHKDPKTQVTSVPDAIHWREFLDAMPVFNQEVAINLPKDGDSVDLTPAKDAWEWFCQTVQDIADGKVKYGHDNRYPCNVTLEARFCAGTVAALGNTSGNHHSMFIEWVTGVYTPGWREFCNYVMKHYIDKYPSARSHWAKYQQDLPGAGIPLIHERYGEKIQKFVEVRNKYNVDPDNMFTTSWLRAIFDLKRPGEQ